MKKSRNELCFVQKAAMLPARLLENLNLERRPQNTPVQNAVEPIARAARYPLHDPSLQVDIPMPLSSGGSTDPLPRRARLWQWRLATVSLACPVQLVQPLLDGFSLVFGNAARCGCSWHSAEHYRKTLPPSQDAVKNAFSAMKTMPPLNTQVLLGNGSLQRFRRRNTQCRHTARSSLLGNFLRFVNE